MMDIVTISLVALLMSPVSTSPVLEKRNISCVKIGTTATANWTNSVGQTCQWTGVVGSNFGANTMNGGEYSCNGRCGAGCSGSAFGNAYTQDCFSHDICSWFNNATGGSNDANCGAAYNAAIDDTLAGVASGCSQTNVVDFAMRPDTEPICS